MVKFNHQRSLLRHDFTVQRACKTSREPGTSLADGAFMRFVIPLFGLLVGGCALTSPAPAGPLRAGTYTQIQPSWALAYGPASMKVNGVPVSGNAQSVNVGSVFVDPFPNPVPLTAGVRQALGPNVEVSGDLGWLDSGVGLRLAIPWLPDAQPLVISAGARSGRVPFSFYESYQGSVSLEAYPVVNEGGTHSHRLMLSAGVAAGTFMHELLLPERYANEEHVLQGPPKATILRPEIRLQTSVGFIFSNDNGAMAFALSPWVLLRGDDPTSARCRSCDAPPVITDYAQTWGLALSIARSIRVDFLH